MPKFIPGHVKNVFETRADEPKEEPSTEDTYEDADEEYESDNTVERVEHIDCIPKSDNERSIIRDVTGILTDANLYPDEIGGDVDVEKTQIYHPRGS